MPLPTLLLPVAGVVTGIAERQMRRVATGRVVPPRTAVQDIDPGRDRPDRQLVGPPMGTDIAVAHGECPVAGTHVAGALGHACRPPEPRPARLGTTGPINLGPEPGLCRAALPVHGTLVLIRPRTGAAAKFAPSAREYGGPNAERLATRETVAGQLSATRPQGPRFRPHCAPAATEPRPASGHHGGPRQEGGATGRAGSGYVSASVHPGRVYQGLRGFVLQDDTGQFPCDPMFETGEGQSNAANTCGVLLAALRNIDQRLTAGGL